MRKTVLVVIGTRPEAIKMAPVIKELKASNSIHPVIVSTGQHREMLQQALDTFQIEADYDLDIMKPGQDLTYITSKVMEGLGPVISECRPEAMLVHGDTTTAMASSLASYYNGVKVGHVEAGLRSFDKYAPYPEEANRRIVGVVADWHFAPTDRAAKHLLSEGVKSAHIIVTGNTVVDAVNGISARLAHSRTIQHQLETAGMSHWDKRIVLVTGHRRENLDGGIERTCNALGKITDEINDLVVVYPVHLNPRVKRTVHEILGGRDRVLLLDPLNYEPFVYLMSKSTMIITDSGGIQEEAAALGKPVLITRDVTERPEVVESGVGRLVGTSPEAIHCHATKILSDPALYNSMAQAKNPFGDGKAAARICDFLKGALC